MKRIVIFIAVITLAFLGHEALAFNLPQDSSRAKYFYVFGPEGSTGNGADDHELELNIDVPQDGAEQVIVAIYDPNTGGSKDWRVNHSNAWDTVTEFELHGSELLDKEQFGSEGYDRRYYQFGPYKKSQGKKVGEAYRFNLKVKATEGDDANLFKVKISPDNAEAFTYNITMRLAPHKGDKMFFYPQVPAGAKSLTVENYDLDREGGTSTLIDDLSNTRYTINDSKTGLWSQTIIPIDTAATRRYEYNIVKGTQANAHAGLRIKDEEGNLLPIYFRKGKPTFKSRPVNVKQEVAKSCNEYLFDATDSYDPDNQELTYKWEFGDGSFSDEPVIKHKFEKAGQYNVRLLVSDNSGLKCETSVTSQAVNVNTPPEAVFDVPKSACAGQGIQLDASSTKDNTLDTLTYMWNFGDKTSGSGQQVSKVYDKGGIYNVVLLVNDNSDSSCNVDTIQRTINVNSRPIAKANEDIDLCLSSFEEYKVDFDASGTEDPDRDKLTYNWDFGDGTSGEGKKVTHVYKESGVYTAKLLINDGSDSPCSSSIDTVKVALNKPPVANAGEASLSCVGSGVLFDGTASSGENGEDLIYTWDFGDGEKVQGAKVDHKYAAPGEYNAVLTVDDGKGTKCSTSMDTVRVVANAKPDVQLAKGDNISCVGEGIAFDASGTVDANGDQLTYVWDFGDGTVEKGPSKVIHNYPNGGTYSVKVTADDGHGTACSTASNMIMAKVNTPPVADAGPNLVCCVGAENVFDGSFSEDFDGDSLKYKWTFSGGKSAEGQKVAHVYDKSGDGTVTLTVDDQSGSPCSVSQDSFNVIINEKPSAVMKVSGR